MDPLSISLAAIAFATALKDLIETIEVIRDLISARPQNYHNAKRLAEEVLQTLRGMEEIYKEHEQTFNKSKSLKKAVNDLQIEMKSAHEQFSRLTPPLSKKKIVRFKIAFYSFWNRRKEEELLSELRDHVDRCSHDFHLLSSLRTEARIIEIHDTIIQSTARGSVEVHEQSSFGNPSMLHSGLGIVTNSQLFSFTQSTPMPMTWIADTIPADDLSKVYLHREVGRVIHSFQSVALARWQQESSTDTEISPSPMTWNLEQSPMPGIVLHQDTLVLTFHIQSLLQQNQSNLWVEDIYREANNLAINLGHLEMHEDSIVVSTLLVDFRKAIARLYPSRKSSRKISLALVNLAMGLLDTGNQSQARLKSDEAIEILRSLTAHEPIDQSKEDIVLITEAVILQERYKPDYSRSLQKALDAGRMLEEALGLPDLRFGMSDISSTETALPSNWAIIVENPEISDDNWYTYASSLLRIAEIHDQPLESHRSAKLAVAVLSHLLTNYPGSESIQNKLSYALALLSDMRMDKIHSHVVIENLEYRRQYIAILQRQIVFDPQRYVLPLARALWAQRQVFIALGRSAEANNVYQDLIGLEDLAVAPPHPNLQIPSQIEGEYYTYLTLCHYIARRFTDAIYAAHNAISQYSALEFIDPRRSKAGHICTLVWLCGHRETGARKINMYFSL